MKMDDLVERYIRLRDEKKAMADEFKLQIAGHDALLDKIEAVLLKVFKETGVDSAATSAGTAYRSTRTTVKVADWDAFFPFVRENDLYHLIERRCSKEGVEQFKAANEDLPPGIDWSEEQVVNVRRPKR